VTSIKVVGKLDAALIGALAAALPLNSTLRELTFLRCFVICNRLSPVFSALGNNVGLKTLKVDVKGSIKESLGTAINDGLRMNETLESLELNHVLLSDNYADSWYRALSFRRTNNALKSLVFVM
jgi:hypothetical protein